jgi:hypothetical protein
MIKLKNKKMDQDLDNRKDFKEDVNGLYLTVMSNVMFCLIFL